MNHVLYFGKVTLSISCLHLSKPLEKLKKGKEKYKFIVILKLISQHMQIAFLGQPFKVNRAHFFMSFTSKNLQGVGDHQINHGLLTGPPKLLESKNLTFNYQCNNLLFSALSPILFGTRDFKLGKLK